VVTYGTSWFYRSVFDAAQVEKASGRKLCLFSSESGGFFEDLVPDFLPEHLLLLLAERKKRHAGEHSTIAGIACRTSFLTSPETISKTPPSLMFRVSPVFIFLPGRR